MSRDTLSQTEIDSLISALSKGELSQEEVAEESTGEYEEYDFRRPTKLAKEQIRTLQVIHENLARIMGNFLAAYLRVQCQVKVVSVNQATYEEFLLSLPQPTVMTVFKMSREMGPAILEVNPSLAMAMIILTFGGKIDASIEDRDLTEIELTVMREINSRLLDNLSYVWKGVADLKPTIEGVDTNPQFNQIMAPSDTVVLVTMSVTLGEREGVVNLCYPYLSLEGVISKLGTQFWVDGASQLGESRRGKRLTLDSLRGVDVDLSACLGYADIGLGELVNLQVGDVIPIERSQKDEIDVYLEDRLAFKAQPGMAGKNLAVSFSRWVDEDDNA